MFDFFKDLPILWVENFNCINNVFLIEQYDIIIKQVYNLEKTSIKYWYNIIKKK